MIKLHIAVFLFGLSGIFGKLLDLPPTAIVLGRTLLATATFFILLRFKKESLLPQKSLWKTLPSGLLLAVHWVSFFHAIQISSIAVALLSFATFPVFVTFMEPCLTHAKPSKQDIGFAFVVFAGLALVIPGYDFESSAFQGALWGVFSGFSFALLTLWNRRLVKTTDALYIGLLQSFWAAMVLLPFGAPLLQMDFTGMLLLGILGVFCTALAHWLFITSMETLRAQIASIATGLEPVYGILLAAILFKEIPSLRVMSGGLIILLAVTLSAFLEKNREKLKGQGKPKTIKSID